MVRNSLTVLAMLLASLSVVAADKGFDDRTYFSPSVLFASPAKGTGFDDGFGLSLAIGKPVTERLAWELNLFGYDQSAVLPGSMRRSGFSISGLYFFADEDQVRPYFIAGAGPLRSRFQGVNNSVYQFHMGLGVMFPASDRMSFRLEGRYMKAGDGIATPHNNWQVLAGLSIPFFGERSMPIPPTPSPVVRQAEPAPAPAPRPAPAPAPAPPPPSFDPVYFVLDSSALDARSRATLDEAVRSMRDHPELVLEVGGYTCTLGTAEYNLSLSERRARAVAEYLVGRGVDASRLVIRGYGQASPIADNATEAGRRMNRRTELVILDR